MAIHRRHLIEYVFVMADEVAGEDNDVGLKSGDPMERLDHIVIVDTRPDVHVADLDHRAAGERRGKMSNRQRPANDFQAVWFNPPGVERDPGAHRGGCRSKKTTAGDVLQDGRHSARSATMGSTLAARRAGTRTAMVAAITMPERRLPARSSFLHAARPVSIPSSRCGRNDARLEAHHPPWFSSSGNRLMGAGIGLYTWRIEPHRLEIVRRPCRFDIFPLRSRPHDGPDQRLHVGTRVDDDYVIETFIGSPLFKPTSLSSPATSSAITNTYSKMPSVYRHFPTGRIATLGIPAITTTVRTGRILKSPPASSRPWRRSDSRFFAISCQRSKGCRWSGSMISGRTSLIRYGHAPRRHPPRGARPQPQSRHSRSSSLGRLPWLDPFGSRPWRAVQAAISGLRCSVPKSPIDRGRVRADGRSSAVH